jgi:hypothetical protein
MDGIGKRGFGKMFNAQSQGDAGKKKQVASDTPKPLDTAKAAANRAEVTTAKSSQDKAQQSDVGSSSDAGKSREISANFKYIGGNTDLANAKVILLGEYHISQHHQNNVDFINTHAENGDIVLIEGLQAYKEMNQFLYTMEKAIYLGNLDRKETYQAESEQRLLETWMAWRRDDKIKEFTKKVTIYGWDNEEAYNEADRRLSYMNVSKREDLNPEDRELLLKREQSMIETINKMRNDFPDKKVFVIAGENHVFHSLEKLEGQEYIALNQKYQPTEKDLQDFLIRRLRRLAVE